MTEAEYQKRITDYCDWLHLTWHHEVDSRKSKSGFPDLVIAGKRDVIFVELKTEKGQTSAAQRRWIMALLNANAHVYTWRPSDWPRAQDVLTRLAKGTLGE